MTTQEIIDELSYYSKRLPRAALTEAPQHRDELVPHLLNAFDHVCDNADKLMAEDSRYNLHFFAMFLLAQFRETQAFPKLVRLLRKNEETLDYFLGDSITEGVNQCLYCVYDGNLGLLKQLIEDASVYEYARSAALEVYTFIARDGRITRAEMIDYFRYLIHERMINDTTIMPTIVCSCVMHEHLFELMSDVKFLYDKDLIELSFHGGYDGFIDYIFDYSRHRKKVYIDNVVKELENWAAYKEEPKPKPKPPVKKLLPKTKKKIGRNDPCPCGSGKKYKKCCLPLGVQFDTKEDEEEPSDSPDDDFIDLLRSSYDQSKPYDLLKHYPSQKPVLKEGQRSFTEFYSPKAIEIDIPVYKALCHREIPIFVRRDKLEEDLERIDFLLEAFAKFTQICEEEHMETFDAFDSKYMVHYDSVHWVGVLCDLLEEYKDKLSEKGLAAREDVDAAFKRMHRLPAADKSSNQNAAD